LSEFSEPPPLPPEEILRPRIDALASRALPQASNLWAEVGDGFVFLDARFYIRDSQVSRAGWALYDLDRESRRAVRFLVGRVRPEIRRTEGLREEAQEFRIAREPTPRELLRPSSIQSGGFRLVRAEPGSAEFLLDAYGLLVPILLSDPVQFVLTLKAIIGWPARVVLRLWTRERSEEPVTRRLDEEIQIEDGELRVGAKLPAGSNLRIRFRDPEGRELELDLETPAEVSA